MRHHNKNKKFSRVTKVRKALINSLARSLVLHEKMETTEPKAKALRPFIEKLVTKGKTATVAARRAVGEKIMPLKFWWILFPKNMRTGRVAM